MSRLLIRMPCLALNQAPEPSSSGVSFQITRAVRDLWPNDSVQIELNERQRHKSQSFIR